MFDAKVAIPVLPQLEVWQTLNVTAFPATGVAAATDALGEAYEDAAGRSHARLPGQLIPMLTAASDTLLRAYR